MRFINPLAVLTFVCTYAPRMAQVPSIDAYRKVAAARRVAV